MGAPRMEPQEPPQKHLDTWERPGMSQRKPEGEGSLKEEEILLNYKPLFSMHLSCTAHK